MQTVEVGSSGFAVTAVGRRGVVRVGSEEWSASTDGPRLPPGAAVRVVERRGLRLHVRRVASRSPATDKAFRQAWVR